MRVYIAGKMRGIKNFNRDAFYQAERVLKSKGYDVFNPVRHDEENGLMLESETGNTDDLPGFNQLSLKGIIIQDIESLLECDAIYLLNGWTDSIGAKAEKAVALWAGLKVMYEAEDIWRV